MENKPEWEGKLIDSQGRIGTISILATGEWQAVLGERTHNIKLNGKIEMEKTDKGMHVRAIIEDKEQGSFSWESKLTSHDAGSYAQEAAMGEYHASEENRGSLMQHGVIVLWKFR